MRQHSRVRGTRRCRRPSMFAPLASGCEIREGLLACRQIVSSGMINEPLGYLLRTVISSTTGKINTPADMDVG